MLISSSNLSCDPCSIWRKSKRYMDINFIIFNSLLAATSATIVSFWLEFNGTNIPRFESISAEKVELKLKQSERSKQERGWYIFSAFILGFFTGTLISLYIKGFIVKQPNDYAVTFYELLGGFLMPNILNFLHRTKIDKYLS